jgi:hypothetical protein
MRFQNHKHFIKQTIMKAYKRYLRGVNSYQILIISDDNRFESIWNEPCGAHQTLGFCPSEFEEGKTIPRGFLSKYGFKKFNPSDPWMDWYNTRLEMLAERGQKITGNFTGNF